MPGDDERRSNQSLCIAGEQYKVELIRDIPMKR